jgi:hypothetical protein
MNERKLWRQVKMNIDDPPHYTVVKRNITIALVVYCRICNRRLKEYTCNETCSFSNRLCQLTFSPDLASTSNTLPY